MDARQPCEYLIPPANRPPHSAQPPRARHLHIAWRVGPASAPYIRQIAADSVRLAARAASLAGRAQSSGSGRLCSPVRGAFISYWPSGGDLHAAAEFAARIAASALPALAPAHLVPFSGNPPDELLEWVGIWFAHVHRMPQPEKDGKSRAALPAFQDDRDDAAAWFSELLQ
jgi:hypothetical protein